MKRVEFTVKCSAVYQSRHDIPDECATDEESILECLRDRIGEAPILDISWLDDLEPCDAITQEDIISIYDVNEG